MLLGRMCAAFKARCCRPGSWLGRPGDRRQGRTSSYCSAISRGLGTACSLRTYGSSKRSSSQPAVVALHWHAQQTARSVDQLHYAARVVTVFVEQL